MPKVKIANDVMMQLFVNGPTWDGDLISKSERDDLVELGLIDCFNGWQWLNSEGMIMALTVDVSGWNDQRWHKKQQLLP